MLYLVNPRGVYSPEVISVMATALERACQLFPNLLDNDEVREFCAWNIIHLVDQGQEDSERLAELAVVEFVRAKGSASKGCLRL
jgi:hypothetical protein